MIDNYLKLKNGIIKQINVNKIKYDVSYIEKSYDTLGVKNTQMSHLRLGYIIGNIGRIPENILDIGYGNGDFLKTCKNIIEKCYGHDVSGYPVNDVEIIDNIYDREFDVVCMFDVLEHLDNIYDISNINTNFFVISVPNCHYKDDMWFYEWKHRKPHEHLWHFDKSALIEFMNEVGYIPINITNIEDTIRKSNEKINILTGVFKRK